MSHASTSIGNPNRIGGLDALRVVVTLFIVGQHALYHSGLLGAMDTQTLVWKVSWAAYALFRCAVDVFVMISGYLLVTQRFKLKRIVSLWLGVLFWALVLYLMQVYREKTAFQWLELRNNLLPILTRRYWFVTSYMGLCILSPMLNHGLRHLSKRSHGLLCLLLVWMCASIPGNVSLLSDRFSTGGETGLMWFVTLYCTAAWFRLHGQPKGHTLCWLLLCLAACGAAWLFGYHATTGEKAGDSYYLYSSLHNHSIFVFGEAIFLFLAFLSMPSKLPLGRFLERLSPLCLAVYLIHDHPQVRYDLWYSLKLKETLGTPYLVPHIIACVFIVCAACMVLEQLRQWLFKPLLRSRWFDFSQIEDWLCK